MAIFWVKVIVNTEEGRCEKIKKWYYIIGISYSIIAWRVFFLFQNTEVHYCCVFFLKKELCLLMLLLFGILLSLLIRAQWPFIALKGYDETLDLPICDCIKNYSMKGSIKFFLVLHHMAECILSWKIKLQMLLTSVIVWEVLISLCSWRRVIWIRITFLLQQHQLCSILWDSI